MQVEILTDEVPPFDPVPTGISDHFTAEGAERAASECQQAWERAGWAGVRFWVDFSAVPGKYIVHGVRSNLVAGCPPVGARRIVAEAQRASSMEAA